MAWVNQSGTLKGPTGITGDKGDKGDKGDTGESGVVVVGSFIPADTENKVFYRIVGKLVEIVVNSTGVTVPVGNSVILADGIISAAARPVGYNRRGSAYVGAGTNVGIYITPGGEVGISNPGTVGNQYNGNILFTK